MQAVSSRVLVRWTHRQVHPSARSNSCGGMSARSVSASAAGQEKLVYAPPIISRPTTAHTATCILLHGLGDTGDGWAAIADQFRPELPNVKFIFPHAPMRAITLNFGMQMPGWYDIASLDDINQREDKEGLLESKRYIEELVKAEAAEGVPSERVVVAGFSQGGATSLMLLRSDIKLAGIIGMSSYLPMRSVEPQVSEVNRGTPVLMCHGDMDQTVAFHYGRESYDQLRKLGVDTEFITYKGMAHSAGYEAVDPFWSAELVEALCVFNASPAELQDVLQFLKTCLK